MGIFVFFRDWFRNGYVDLFRLGISKEDFVGGCWIYFFVLRVYFFFINMKLTYGRG